MSNVNILVSGIYWSGSGAIVDLLKEFKDIAVVSPPNEFDDFRRFGLLGDLLSNNQHGSSCNSIESFSKKRIHSAFSLKGIAIKTGQLLKLLGIEVSMLKDAINNRERYKSLNKLVREIKNESDAERAILLSKIWIQELGNIYGPSSFVLFDQPIFHGIHLDVWPKVFDPFKLIIVYRDPRDQLSQIIKSNHLFFDLENNLTYNLGEIYGYDRIGMIQYQCEAIKSRYDSLLRIFKTVDNKKLLLLKFEDLVFQYESELNRIVSFLNLKHDNHTLRFTKFRPDESVKNIGIYKNYLFKEEIEYMDELYKLYQNLERELTTS